MLSLGAFAFANGWLLAALAVLPILWWLLRVTPPAPRLVRFPAIRLLLRLRQEEETPAHTPLWLLLLRLILASLLIVALAHPLINPRAGLPANGPLVLVVDNGWASARHWAARQTAMTALIDQAERTRRPVILLPTAPPEAGGPLRAGTLLRSGEARERARALRPLPWPVDRAAARAAVRKIKIAGSANVVWLSNGLDDGGRDGDGAARALASALQTLGRLRVLVDPDRDLARMLMPPRAEGRGLSVEIARAAPGGADRATVIAAAADGRVLARKTVRIAEGRRRGAALIALPTELRNRVTRLSIETEPSAGATVLLDDRWRRRPVGIVSGSSLAKDQPLLSDHYYLDRALRPFAELRHGTIGALLGRALAILILTDTRPATETERRALERWMRAGGMLLRFAGPRLAAEPDSLVPVKLRRGDRTFGGAMSWTRPMRLAPFEASSPFAGLTVPDDVLVRRQVLAEPAADLARRTWGRLADGTPLVTAESRGKGMLVLVHTTANMAWSNLPISGLFVDMLRRLMALSHGVVGKSGTRTLPPLTTLDGFGRLTSPPATAAGIAETAFAATKPGPRHPPGFYGNDSLRRALNLSAVMAPPRALGALPPGVVRETYGRAREVDLKPWLLAAALLLALIDILIALALRGYLPRRAGGMTAAVLVLLVATMPTPPLRAEEAARSGDAFAIAATTRTRLAYVGVGDPAVDSVVRAGLIGLGRVLARRTAVELADPVRVDVERDELAFFPLLYWPVVAVQPALSPLAQRRLAAYLRHGGMIVFDTRAETGAGADPGLLRALVRGLNLPALEPVPPGHVLTKAFYLLQRFPGRWADGRVWVERQGRQGNDDVSSVVIGGNDWVGAWAVDAAGRPMFPVVPGGEAQREQAYRFGVNLVMYALTGNYKADQVHVPTILRRLGQ